MAQDPNVPRLLTSEEIEYILSATPVVHGSDREASEFIRQQVMDRLREQLEEIELTPLGIEEMRNENIRRFNQARIEPHSTVGPFAAESMGQMLSQMKLSAKHTAGMSKSSTDSFKRVQELMNLSVNPSNRNCTVFFKDLNIGFDDIIFEKKADIVQILAGQVIKDYILDRPDNIKDPVQDGWWYSLYEQTIKSNVLGKIPYILRLLINTVIMYTHRVTMAMLADTLEREFKGQVVVVYSPLSEGKLDIYPVNTESIGEVGAISRDELHRLYLINIVKPSLDKIQVKGIYGITSLFPRASPVISGIVSEVPVAPRHWHLYLNRLRVLDMGITKERVSRLATAVGLLVHINSDVPERLKNKVVHVEVPENLKISAKDKVLTRPIDIINEVVNINKNLAEAEERKMPNNPFPRASPNEVTRASVVIYAETDGTNLRALLQRDDIDETKTISNDVNEILAVFGIEALRNTLIAEYIFAVAESGNYINPKHVLQIANYQTNHGKKAINFGAFSREPVGPIDKAAYGKPLDVFSMAAAYGLAQEVNTIPSSIFVGKRAAFGTTNVEIETDAGYIDVLRQLEEESATGERLSSNLDVSSFSSDISRLTEAARVDVEVSNEQIKSLEDNLFSGLVAQQALTPSPQMRILDKSPVLFTPGVIPNNPRNNLTEKAMELVKEATCLEPSNTITNNQGIPPSKISAPKQTLPPISKVPISKGSIKTNIGVPQPPLLSPLGGKQPSFSGTPPKQPTNIVQTPVTTGSMIPPPTILTPTSRSQRLIAPPVKPASSIRLKK